LTIPLALLYFFFRDSRWLWFTKKKVKHCFRILLMKREIYNGRMTQISKAHPTRIAVLLSEERKCRSLGRWSVPCNVRTDKLLNETRPKSWRQSLYLRLTSGLPSLRCQRWFRFYCSLTSPARERRNIFLWSVFVNIFI